MSIECECNREIPHDVIIDHGYIDGEDYETMIETLREQGYFVMKTEQFLALKDSNRRIA